MKQPYKQFLQWYAFYLGGDQSRRIGSTESTQS